MKKVILIVVLCLMMAGAVMAQDLPRNENNNTETDYGNTSYLWIKMPGWVVHEGVCVQIEFPSGTVGW